MAADVQFVQRQVAEGWGFVFSYCLCLYLQKQVFLPPDRRMEELEDKQLEMERAFEDMYTKQMSE